MSGPLAHGSAWYPAGSMRATGFCLWMLLIGAGGCCLEPAHASFGPAEEALVLTWRVKNQAAFGGCIEHRLRWREREVDGYHLACCDDCDVHGLGKDIAERATWARTSDGVLGVRTGNVVYRLAGQLIVCDDNASRTTQRADCARNPELAEIITKTCQDQVAHGGATLAEKCEGTAPVNDR